MQAVAAGTITQRQYCLLVTMVSVAWQDLSTFLIIQLNVIVGLNGQRLTPAFHSGLLVVTDW